jgi:hypothetical protein
MTHSVIDAENSVKNYLNQRPKADAKINDSSHRLSFISHTYATISKQTYIISYLHYKYSIIL